MDLLGMAEEKIRGKAPFCQKKIGTGTSFLAENRSQSLIFSEPVPIFSEPVPFFLIGWQPILSKNVYI